MILVTTDSFTGFQELAESNQTVIDIQAYIDKFETQYIYKLLGVAMGKDFIIDRQTYDSITPKVTVGSLDASAGLYPTVGSGGGGAIVKGDSWTITVSGTIGIYVLSVGDILYAKINAPVADADWYYKQIRYTVIQNAFAEQTDNTDLCCDGRIHESEGMTELLASLIFYQYVNKTQGNHSQSGVMIIVAETGTTLSPRMATRYGEVRWNDALNSTESIFWYCKRFKPEIYPDFRGQKFPVQYSSML